MSGLYFPAQNLVPNYSFENLNSCTNPLSFNQLTSWCDNSGYELLFNSCLPSGSFGGVPKSIGQMYQMPKTGNGYGSVSLYSNFLSGNRRTYIQVQLSQSLHINKKYLVKFYINLNNDSRYAVDKACALLTTTPLPCNTMSFSTVLASPQIVNSSGIIKDTLNWVEICDTMTSVGNENYIIIGNFFSNASTNISFHGSASKDIAYYNVEDVYVEELISANAKSDVSICLNDSIIIGNNTTESATYSWLPTIGLRCSFCPNPTASPTVTTKYIVTKQNCNIITKDSITVTVKPICNTAQPEIPNVFTPNGDGINDTFHIDLDAEFANISFTVYNRWGLMVKKSEEPTYNQISWDGRTTSGESCNAGVYFYVLQFINAKGDLEKKNGYITLFR